MRKGDLADRGVFLHLPPFQREAPGRRGILGAFHEVQARILGGLLDAVVGALCELPSVRMEDLPRMADFARFGEAMGRGLGWPAGTFLRAYRENRREATASTIENSVLGTMLLKRPWSTIFRGHRDPDPLARAAYPRHRGQRTLARMPKTATASGTNCGGWGRSFESMASPLRSAGPATRDRSPSRKSPDPIIPASRRKNV